MIKIIEYDSIYDEQIKDLLIELQNYLIDIDDWHTQILSDNYREDYFKMDLELINKQDGKIFLAIEDTKIIGLVLGAVNLNDEIDKLTNDCAKTGNVLELIIKNSSRGHGIGKLLLKEKKIIRNRRDTIRPHIIKKKKKKSIWASNKKIYGLFRR